MGDEVIKVLNHLCDKFGIAIDWTSSNVMPYLQDLMSRIVKYGIYQNVSDIICCLIFLLIAIIITRKLYKASYKYASIYKETNKHDDKDNASFFTMAFLISLATTAFVTAMALYIIKESVDEIIELSTVPEKYVIEIIQEQIDE
jgi:hypothetical protein